MVKGIKQGIIIFLATMMAILIIYTPILAKSLSEDETFEIDAFSTKTDKEKNDEIISTNSNSDEDISILGAVSGTANGFTYNVNEDGKTATITGYEWTPSGSLYIPKFIDSYTVTGIGNHAFVDCSGFTGSLTIPNSVTDIGDYAFFNCSGFTGSLTIPGSVTSIGDHAFADCKGFTGNLTISGGVTSIGDYAFSYCSGLTGSLTIPDSVTSIGDYAFYYCSGLTGSLAIPDSVTSIGDYAFFYCSGLTGSLIIPDSVTSIGDDAFYYCSGFTGSLAIPDSVTSIGDGAFAYCSGFTGSLAIPDSVTSIGELAFYYCSGLTGSLTISGCVTNIGNFTFNGCGFTGSLIIPDSVTSIGNYVFADCRGFTGSLTIPSSVIYIGYGAFECCHGLRKVDNNSSITFDLTKLKIGNTGKTWRNEKTGEAITAISNGVAIREDFVDSGIVLENLLKTDPAVYNNNLALISAKLSSKTYDNDGENDESVRGYLIYDLGFNEENIYTSDDYGGSHAFTVAAKRCSTEDDCGIIIIVARGTKTIEEKVLDDVFGKPMDINTYSWEGYSPFSGAYYFADRILKSPFMEKTTSSLSCKKYKVLITGHSLGGAAANLVAAKISKTINCASDDSVYCYTFGAINSIDVDSPIVNGYKYIHNIYNEHDTFSPTEAGWILAFGAGSRNGKFGWIDAFRADYRSDNEKWQENLIVLDRYKRDEIKIRYYTNHNMYNYLEAVESGKVEDSSIRPNPKPIIQPVYAVLGCPVDVDVYCEDSLVGRVVNNEVDTSVTSINIFVDEDVKFILFEGGKHYTLKIKAFDEGTMTYYVQDLGNSGQVKMMTNVSLVKDKTMISEVGTDISVPDTELLIVNEKGEIIAKVQPDGTEVEVKNDAPSENDINKDDAPENSEGNHAIDTGLQPIETQYKNTINVKEILLPYFTKAHPDAVVKKMKFKSSNKKVAKVNKKGIAKGGKNSGTATITMFVKTEETVTKPNGKQKKKLSKWISACTLDVNNTGKQGK